MLGGDRRGQLVLAGVEQLAEREQHLGAPGQRRVPPLRPGADGGRDRRVDVGRGGQVDLAGDLPGRRVVDLAGALRLAVPGLAADPVRDARRHAPSMRRRSRPPTSVDIVSDRAGPSLHCVNGPDGCAGARAAGPAGRPPARAHRRRGPGPAGALGPRGGDPRHRARCCTAASSSSPPGSRCPTRSTSSRPTSGSWPPRRERAGHRAGPPVRAGARGDRRRPRPRRGCRWWRCAGR